MYIIFDEMLVTVIKKMRCETMKSRVVVANKSAGVVLSSPSSTLSPS